VRGGALALGGLVVVTVGLSAVFWQWQRWLGETKDPGPVSFSTLVRIESVEDALICPASVCAHASPDLEPPVLTSPADAIEKELIAYARRVKGIDAMARKPTSGFYRFVERPTFFGAPIFVDVMVEPLSSRASTVAIYTRGIGAGDHAAKLERARAWLRALEN
jgi:hypothetical protein